MTTTFTAIETHYAGCRFRSRLEARWAVFFDAMGIEWRYEPEGYELEHRITLKPGTIRYLPDFWLPDLNLHVEVKGHLDWDEMLRLLDCAADLSSPSGGCGGGSGDMLVCGQIPRPRSNTHPVVLHMHKGALMPTALPDAYRCGDGWDSAFAYDFGGYVDTVCHGHIDGIIETLLNGAHHRCHPDTANAYEAAYTAARQARFEHGETPSPPRHARPADAARAELAARRSATR